MLGTIVPYIIPTGMFRNEPHIGFLFVNKVHTIFTFICENSPDLLGYGTVLSVMELRREQNIPGSYKTNAGNVSIDESLKEVVFKFQSAMK